MPRRLLGILVGLLAGGTAAVFRLAGVFQGMDANLFQYLRLPENQSGVPLWLDLIVSFLFAFGAVLVAYQINSGKVRVALLGVIILQPVSAVAVGLVAGHGISPFSWLTAILTVVLGLAVYRFSIAGKRDRLLLETFGIHLSAEALRKLAQQPDALSSRTARATILNASPQEDHSSNVEALASHLREKDAWVEVQAGNRILAVWNSPLTLGAPENAGIEAAFGQMKNWHAGVATGDVRMELLPSTNTWQMAGEVFDNAAALCRANAIFGTGILLDLPTADAVRDDFILRPVDLFVQPGTDLGMEIFEPIALTEAASSETVSQRDQYWEGVIFFRQQRYSEALASFKKVAADPLVQYYLKRLENLTSPA